MASIELSEPGTFWVDSFPLRMFPYFVRKPSADNYKVTYLPAWMPGASFRRMAQQMWTDHKRMYEISSEHTKA